MGSPRKRRQQKALLKKLLDQQGSVEVEEAVVETVEETEIKTEEVVETVEETETEVEAAPVTKKGKKWL